MPYISTSSPLPTVMSTKDPLPVLRYKALRVRFPPGVQLLPFTRNRSGQPSPSASKNAPPEPSVSGRYFFPARPLLWVKRTPAAAVTSVNVTPPGAADTAAPSSRNGRIQRVIVFSICQVRPEFHALVFVDLLPLVVVLGADHAARPRDGLRCLFRLESHEELLFTVRKIRLAET